LIFRFFLEFLTKGVPQALQGPQELLLPCLALLVLKVLRGLRESLVVLVLLVSKVRLVLRVLMEQLVPRDLLVPKVQLDLQVQQESTEI
jgi:hypothetical protein